MMRKLLLLLVFIQINVMLVAQNYRVTGICEDKTGKALEMVSVYSATANPSSVNTNKFGEYELFFEKEADVILLYRIAGLVVQENVSINKAHVRVKPIQFKFQQVDGVVAGGNRDEPFVLDKLPTIDWQKLPIQSIEKGLVYTTSASSNNELTSNYNVRGGSYDENLVYVNGFNIYRPFLTRSGQQEGMSFLHTALVESIQFSGGGFDARYGDKLSSVLDITYKTPDSLRGSAMLSLLGVEAHVEHAPTARFNFLVGARFRSNGYLLNSLPTKGAYNPVFWDAQLVTNYAINEKLTWSLLGHFSSNNYQFTPQTSKTDFGTYNEAYSFVIYFEGQEQTQFTSMTGGTSLKYKPNKKTNLDFYATVFNTIERESFDILGEYYINELETDPSKEEFGDSIAVLGVGGFLNHARNELNATIVNIYHDGSNELFKGYKNNERTKFASHNLKWGVNFQMDYFEDELSEWKLIDSAGYSVSESLAPEVSLFESVKSNLSLEAQRYTGYAQLNSIWSNNKRDTVLRLTKRHKIGKHEYETRSYTDTVNESPSRWALSLGARTGYTSSNQEFYVTPRASLKYYPRSYMVKNGKIVRRNTNIHLASGLYYQPPFYREFRTAKGELNLDVKAQKSAHVVFGTDYYFGMWDREVPFKFTAEAYYKYMWDVNPYEVDNVRIRYYADNDAVAYAYGLDLNIHGQFIEGIESFFKIGFLSTKEDLLSDYYYDYYNAGGDKIVFGNSEDQVVTDSVRVEPGFIPRPTDQLINFAALIQDRMPGHESLSVQMGLLFGSRLPYGPPDFNHYKDTLRIKSYFRVDIGMSYDFLYKKKEKKNFWNKNFTDAILSFEVFNLLGVNNVLSKQWVQDTQGRYYSIPNYLTQRRFNLKMILRF
ncbi:MAG: TonB-dependent receptor plug domain-containing protein [Flavobacteriales bacterium]|nr:TonB-dependent receptor plug domain-containing protein [Flavobacteriales bacterium]